MTRSRAIRCHHSDQDKETWCVYWDVESRGWGSPVGDSGLPLDDSEGGPGGPLHGRAEVLL